MCRNIKPLFNYEPPATAEEIEAAARQYIRKVSGMTKPSTANQEAFEAAVTEVAAATSTLIAGLVTSAAPRDREVDRQRAVERGRRRDERLRRRLLDQ